MPPVRSRLSICGTKASRVSLSTHGLPAATSTASQSADDRSGRQCAKRPASASACASGTSSHQAAPPSPKTRQSVAVASASSPTVSSVATTQAPSAGGSQPSQVANSSRPRVPHTPKAAWVSWAHATLLRMTNIAKRLKVSSATLRRVISQKPLSTHSVGSSASTKVANARPLGVL